MPKVSTTVEVVTLYHKLSGEFVTELVSAYACEPFIELWQGRTTGRFFIYHHDFCFYDEKLQWRRKTGNMISPRKPRERLAFVGCVYGGSYYCRKEYTELSRAKLKLRRVLVDEV